MHINNGYTKYMICKFLWVKFILKLIQRKGKAPFVYLDVITNGSIIDSQVLRCLLLPCQAPPPPSNRVSSTYDDQHCLQKLAFRMCVCVCERESERREGEGREHELKLYTCVST